MSSDHAEIEHDTQAIAIIVNGTKLPTSFVLVAFAIKVKLFWSTAILIIAVALLLKRHCLHLITQYT